MNAVKRGFFSLWYRKKTALLLFWRVPDSGGPGAGGFLHAGGLPPGGAGPAGTGGGHRHPEQLPHRGGGPVRRLQPDLPGVGGEDRSPGPVPRLHPPTTTPSPGVGEPAALRHPGAAGEVPPGIRLDPGGGHGGHDRRRGVRHRGLPNAGRPDAGGDRHLLRGDQQRHGPRERGIFGRGSHPGRLLHGPRGTGHPRHRGGHLRPDPGAAPHQRPLL